MQINFPPFGIGTIIAIILVILCALALLGVLPVSIKLLVVFVLLLAIARLT